MPSFIKKKNHLYKQGLKVDMDKKNTLKVKESFASVLEPKVEVL